MDIVIEEGKVMGAYEDLLTDLGNLVRVCELVASTKDSNAHVGGLLEVVGKIGVVGEDTLELKKKLEAKKEELEGIVRTLRQRQEEMSNVSF